MEHLDFANVRPGSRLWLVRHAQPMIDTGVCYGALDMPADASATAVAAQVLAAALPEGVPVRVSPLQRCQQLALAVSELRSDFAFTTEPGLTEMNFGCWEGQRWDAIPQPAFANWQADFGNHRFGGGESVSELMARVSVLWHRWSDPPAAKDQVWITHAGVIRAVVLLAQGISRVQHAAQWPRQAPDYGQWCTLGVNQPNGPDAPSA